MRAKRLVFTLLFAIGAQCVYVNRDNNYYFVFPNLTYIDGNEGNIAEVDNGLDKELLLGCPCVRNLNTNTTHDAAENVMRVALQ